MDNKTIATKMTRGIDERVSACHGWCQITDLNGEMDEGLFLATFADDSRIVFEDDQHGFLHVLLTKDQDDRWNELYEEERIDMLEEILLFYHRFMADAGREVFQINKSRCKVTLDLSVDSDNPPNTWDWSKLLNLPEADVAFIKCEEV